MLTSRRPKWERPDLGHGDGFLGQGRTFSTGVHMNVQMRDLLFKNEKSEESKRVEE
jgi:hypothetical protein